MNLDNKRESIPSSFLHSIDPSVVNYVKTHTEMTPTEIKLQRTSEELSKSKTPYCKIFYEINEIGTITLPSKFDFLLDEYRKRKGYSSKETVIKSAIGTIVGEHKKYGHIKKDESFRTLLKNGYYSDLNELILFGIKELFEKENMWNYRRFTDSEPKTKPIE